MDEALALLSRKNHKTVPLAGGTVVNQPRDESWAVVDLQDLGLDTLQQRGNFLEIGAMVTLQGLLAVDGLSPALRQSIQLEATYNLRQVATVAGTLMAASGRSPFASAMLALDARLQIQPGDKHMELGEMFLSRPDGLAGQLVTSVTVPLNVRLAYHSVARTPADLPLVCAAVGVWPSGRVRVALGGYGQQPIMALDGPEPGGLEEAVRIAYAEAGDTWASAEYRRETAVILVRRGYEEASSIPVSA
jgi:CO/xanthine dehydrogenase FAD-binding subunit